LMLGMMGSAILRAHGDARRAMMATIAGGIVNAILDPILIFGFNLDLTGAALASFVARVVIAYTALMPIVRHYGGIARPRLAGMWRDLFPVLAIAVPAILTQVATPVGQAYVTRAMAAYGEDAVAGMAIVSRMMPVAFAVIFALSGAVGPIIGQNFGAGDMGRVKRTYNAGILFAGIVIVTISAGLFLTRGPLAALFDADGITMTLIFLFCGPLSLAFFFNGVLFVSNAAFNNMGHPYYSTVTNWGRNTVGMVPLVWLGSVLFGAPGVLIGQAAAGVLFGGLAWMLALRLISSGGRPKEQRTEVFGREGRLMALLHLRR
jgi:Na+-driven multidrug efflux pump